MRSFFRRRIIVDRFQYRLLAANLCYLTIICIAAAALVFGPMLLELRGPPSHSPEREATANVFLYLNARIWPIFLVLFPLIALHSIILSHRVAGPLYRFRQVFKSAENGDLSGNVRIRRNDYLKNDVTCINEMLVGLRGKAAAIKEAFSELAGAFSEFRDGTSGGADPETRNGIESLDGKVEALGRCLQQIKVEPSRQAQDKNPQGESPVENKEPGRQVSPGTPVC